jgi:hypothetical protein
MQASEQLDSTRVEHSAESDEMEDSDEEQDEEVEDQEYDRRMFGISQSLPVADWTPDGGEPMHAHAPRMMHHEALQPG